MIIHCPACRALAAVERASLAEGGERIGLCCPECGETSWLPVEAPKPSAEAPKATTEAPKAAAEAPKPAEEALRTALRELPAPSQDQRDIADAFVALRERQWEERPAHRALLQRAAASDALPTVGLRYRRVLEHAPDDVMAKWGQQEIIHLAMASIAPQLGGSEAEPASRRVALIVAGVTLLGVLVVLLYVFRSVLKSL